MKNPNDKYYAPPELVKFIVKKTLDNIDSQNITEIMEPAAGNGAFIPYIKQLHNKLGVPYKFSDIKPEHPEVKYGDFLKDVVPYKKGRLVITGPPYSNKGWYSFAIKASAIADYVAFISPMSVYNIKHPVPTLELIAQYELGPVDFLAPDGGKSKKVQTCVMIYKRCFPKIDKFKFDIKKDMKISFYKKNNPPLHNINYDYYLSFFGDNAGSFSIDKNAFSASIAIKLYNEKLRPKLLKFLKNFRKNHLDDIDKYATTVPKKRIINMTRFREWLKEEVYD